MKKITLSFVAAAMLSATSALAADMKPILKAPPPAESPWDIAFGGALMSDYNFRGISQSQRGPSGTVYSETRYNVNKDLQLYVGSQVWAVDLPTNPSCECDFYGGIRPTIGGVAFDFGFIYYYYPKETGYFGTWPTPANGATFPAFLNGNTTLNDTDFWEVYGKFTYEVVKDTFAIGGNVYYSPSWLHSGAPGTYASFTAKYTGKPFQVGIGLVKDVGWYVSGEVGHYWIGTTDVNNLFLAAVDLPDYTTWNVGLAFTFAKVFTLDVRYYDTDLSKSNCNILTSDPRAVTGGVVNSISNPNGLQSRLCGAAGIVTLKADLTYKDSLK
jgi:uncharacterized protein (TIGR02001 family)